MMLIASALAAAACGPAKTPVAPTDPPGKSTAGSGAAAPPTDQDGKVTDKRRVYDFSGDTLEPDPAGAEVAAAGPPDVPANKANIRRELRRHMGGFAACAAKDASATGEVTIVFGVAASGAIGDVYVTGAGNDELHTCMHGIAKGMTFAVDPGGVATEVHYPLAIQRP